MDRASRSERVGAIIKIVGGTHRQHIPNTCPIGADSLDRLGIAVLGGAPFVVNEETRRDLDLALEPGVVEVVGVRRGHGVSVACAAFGVVWCGVVCRWGDGSERMDTMWVDYKL
jgi:hypothetical protein